MLLKPVEMLKKYVDMPSGSYDAADVAALAEIIAADFADIGFNVEKIENEGFGPTLVCRWGRGEKQLLLLGHMDTVFRHDEYVPFRMIDETRCMGSGSCDMKGGIVIMLHALVEAMSAVDPEKYTLCAVINPDEEIGSRMSFDTILNEAKKSYACISFEPGLKDHRLVCERKGITSIKVSCEGIPGHAGGNYRECASAVQALCAQITRLYTLRDDEKDISFNAGIISGGTARNVIAAHAECICEFRCFEPELQQETEKKAFELTADEPVPGVKTTVEVFGRRPAIAVNEKSLALFDIAGQVIRDKGFETGLVATGGAGDIAIAGLAGIGVMDKFGMIGDKIHTLDEYSRIDLIPEQIDIAAETIRRLCR